MTHISLMLAVPHPAAASAWYQRVLGATELWNLGPGGFFDPFGHLWLVGDTSRLHRHP